ncbi:MAG: ABC transporter permease [Proteobacteria bacterium]|nr:ABC transporter permease [Pseudomonadota bacterium]
MSEATPARLADRQHPLIALVNARLREFIREPAAIFWVYGFPLLMMVALGVAFRDRPVDQFTVVVQKGAGVEKLVDALQPDERFRVELYDQAESRRRLRTGKTDLVIVAQDGGSGGYDFYFDPTRPGSSLARSMANDVLQRAAGRDDVVASRIHETSEPGGRYIDFLVPGLLGMGLMGGGLWGLGFAIVDMRLRKLLKRYVATPMKRSHFLAALGISRLVFTIPEILVLLAFAHFFFGVVNHGSYLALGVLVVLGAFCFTGIGLLVGSRAETLETASGLMNLVMLPMWILSGIFFSVDRFPEAIQPIIMALPLTPVIDSMRQVMLEGVSLSALGMEIAIVAAWGAITFVLALRWFRWT